MVIKDILNLAADLKLSVCFKIMPQVIKIIMFFKICFICFRKGPIHLWGTWKSWVLSLPAHQRYMGSVGYFGILTQTSWIYLSQRAGTCYQWRYWWEWDKQSWAHTWWPDHTGIFIFSIYTGDRLCQLETAAAIPPELPISAVTNPAAPAALADQSKNQI